MKLVKRISLFMTLSVIMLGLGGWGALKAEEFFYPHRYRNSYEQAGTGSAGRWLLYTSEAAGERGIV